ncbi:hypothetical protein EDM68_01205 [Candidatus Uhrbacteria bacterium]|nr:MAG: hypothetical protein EDM68_01205 [Candidatus Uhrbacteria bacterium]
MEVRIEDEMDASGDPIALVRLRPDGKRTRIRVERLRAQDLGRPQLFDVSPDEAVVSLCLQLGNVVFLSGSDALAGFLNRPADLGELVDACRSMREFPGRRSYQRRLVGPCARSLVSSGKRWADLGPPGEDGYHVIGMDEERRRVFAFRSTPTDRSFKHQLCHATISVADRAASWVPLAAPPGDAATFVDASRFVRVVFDDGRPAATQAVIRLADARGFETHRLLTIEETDDGPIPRWSDPFRADYPVLGPDWRERAIRKEEGTIPNALLLQEAGAHGYALHRLPLTQCRVQQLYAYFVNAGNL